MKFAPVLRWLLGLLCCLLLGSTAVAEAQTMARPELRSVPASFQSILPNLQQQTEVPIVLPTWIPTQAIVTDPTTGKRQPYLAVPIQNGRFAGVYPYVLQATPTRYEISLDALPAPACRGASSCAFGLLTGEKLLPDTPSVPQLYAYQTQDPNYHPIARSPEKPGPVMLARGIQGYFIPFVCGANCDSAKVFWEQNGYCYGVGIRYAARKTLIRMANSAIENESQP